MKTNLYRFIFFFAFLFVLIACSTKKDRFVNREFQALNSKFNVLYNGNLALDKGVEDLKLQYRDNFWERLPVERMTITKENIMPGEAQKNANFQRAEEKATKAIQKRSMNIEGKEKNPQMDEAHLLLGKARYYDQRFIPALEAFNYVLYKYPESDKIYEVKIWREKTNMRMENDALAVINLRKLLNDIKFKDQIFADANATLAQAYLNLQEKDSALAKLKIATDFTELDEEQARYRFISGQLLDEMGEKDSAFAAYQSVIDMKRKSPRRYVIQAHIQQAKYFDAEKGDTIAFLEKYKDLLKDRENRPFLDFLNHQVALFYDNQDNHRQAKKYYNTSLRTNSEDQYLIASNYRNLAMLYFDDAKYPTAGTYYDSTLAVLDARSREHKAIQKKRDNLADVIKYEAIAQTNDSILNLVGMSDNQRLAYFEDHIAKLKVADEKAAKLLKKQQELAEIRQAAGGSIETDIKKNPNANTRSGMDPPSAFGPKPTTGSETFYFYNPTTIAYGKNEFRKKWGDRKLQNNWRMSGGQSNSRTEEEETEAVALENAAVETVEKTLEPKYTTDFYLAQIPKEQAAIDVLVKDRNFAYYQLGVIYKEKFQEYALAADKLERLLKNNPEERLILPSMYNLYKIYEIINPEKAVAMKNEIIAKYPNSRYAQIISNENLNDQQLSELPEAVYARMYTAYESNDLFKVLEDSERAIDRYTGDEIAAKFELLKANTVGKLKGLAEYKKALNFVALNYPNAEEGKAAEKILSRNIPYMEKLQFDSEVPNSFKIVYRNADTLDLRFKGIYEKIKKFASERTIQTLSLSVDIYNMTERFLVLHGIETETQANDILTILRDYKDYKINEPAIVISTENYKIVQIKKKIEDYLTRVPKTPVADALPTLPLPEESEPTGPKAQDQPKQASPKATPKKAEALQQSGPPMAPGQKPIEQKTKRP